MKNYFILITCLFMVSCSNKQSESKKTDTSIKIDLNTTYDALGQGAMILYPISEMEDSMRSKISFPNLPEITDTTFAYIFFTGKNHAAIDNQVLVLVGDRTSKSPLIWVDYNNDLDFSDAKKPLRFSKKSIDISISDTQNPELIYVIRFHKVDSARKAEIKKSLEQFVLKGEKCTDFFMDERRNIKVGDFVYKKDSLRIGIMDWNVNGSYSDWGTDRLVIGKYKGNINGTEEVDGAVMLDSITYFQGPSYAFEILKVANTGQSITIKPTLSTNIKDMIANGDTIPDYAFELSSGKKTSVHTYLDGNKYVYLSFWATWCSGCRQEVEDLKKIHADHSDKVTVISLNYNEGAEKIRAFLDKYEIKWLNGYSTEKINTELRIQGMPRNILIDPKGRIVEMNIHPSNLLDRITDLH